MKNINKTKRLFGNRTFPFTSKVIVLLAFLAFFGFNEIYAQRTPIKINLIIDGSASLSNVKNDVNSWISNRLDQIQAEGDTLTVWSAGTSARIIYSGADKEEAKKSIQAISPSGSNADFSGALKDAGSRSYDNSPFSYTLLVSASPDALSSVISGPQSNLLRFSRVEEFSAWRALVIGTNIDTKVRRAAAAFISNR